MKTFNISVVGLGFVGLTLAVVNAKKGFKTIGIDVNKKKLDRLEKGQPDFFEPKLDKYLKKSLKQKKIEFTNDFNKILKTDITFVTVGTPSSNQGKIDLTYIKNASKQIAKILKKKKKKHLIVIKSTVIPTTTLKILFPIFSRVKNTRVVINPEFLRESNAINDLLNPHLIVIGENTPKDGDDLIKYYKQFYKKSPEILRTELTSAEMIKYANNSFLATKISFINSIANICQNIPNTNVDTIANAIGKDPRIGPLFLNAGSGFGGSCLPKDLNALIHFSKHFENSNDLFTAVKSINEKQPTNILKIMKSFGVLSKNHSVAILGLAFKKDTDDIRDSIAIKLVKLFTKFDMKIKVHDPMAMQNFKKLFSNNVTYCKTSIDCIKKSDVCIILVDWNEYKKLNEKDFLKNMNNTNIIDVKRILINKKFHKVNYKGIGVCLE